MAGDEDVDKAGPQVEPDKPGSKPGSTEDAPDRHQHERHGEKRGSADKDHPDSF